MREMLWKTQRG